MGFHFSYFFVLFASAAAVSRVGSVPRSALELENDQLSHRLEVEKSKVLALGLGLGVGLPVVVGLIFLFLMKFNVLLFKPAPVIEHRDL